ncbi:hypothetical protein [Azospirillum formosense]|uniref:hypothetical protein n=1 Tax=Azospirillum formosense TaxID=861533 RepID=UPI00338DE585
MTRSDARAMWNASGLTYADLKHENLHRLISMIDAEMKASGMMQGSYRMCRKLGLRHRNEVPTQAAIRCKANYFGDREAVTFNSDGFIGFGGWADDTSIAPILTGFTRWVSEMRAALSHREAQGGGSDNSAR